MSEGQCEHKKGHSLTFNYVTLSWNQLKNRKNVVV